MRDGGQVDGGAARGGRGPPGRPRRAGRDRRRGLARDAAARAARQGGQHRRRRLAAPAGRGARGGDRLTGRGGPAEPGQPVGYGWTSTLLTVAEVDGAEPRWSRWTPWSAGSRRTRPPGTTTHRPAPPPRRRPASTGPASTDPRCRRRAWTTCPGCGPRPRSWRNCSTSASTTARCWPGSAPRSRSAC